MTINIEGNDLDLEDIKDLIKDLYGKCEINIHIKIDKIEPNVWEPYDPLYPPIGSPIWYFHEPPYWQTMPCTSVAGTTSGVVDEIANQYYAEDLKDVSYT